MSFHARQPTLLSMVVDQNASPPTTSPKARTETVVQDASPNRTELEPTPLLLALDMAAERKRLRSRKDSVLTGLPTEDEYVEVEKVEVQSSESEQSEGMDGDEVIIVVKEDLNQLALLGQSVSSRFWNGVEGVRKGVWGLAGWA